MAISTMDQLVAALAGAQTIGTYEASLTAKAAGDWQSLWTAAGFPGAGSTPGSGAGSAPTNATAGALPFVNPSGSNTAYLASFACSGATVGTVFLYDRLVHTAGLSGNSNTAQTVDSTALTRYTSGVGVQGWLEVYTAWGSTSPGTATISYTNQAGSSGQSGSATLIASAVAGQCFPITLAAGDTGIQSIQTVTLATASGTAGSFGVTLAYPIAVAPIQIANVAAPPQDFSLLGLPVIENNACLAYRVLCSTTSTGIIMTQLSIVQG